MRDVDQGAEQNVSLPNLAIEPWEYAEVEYGGGRMAYQVRRRDGQGPVMPAMTNEDGAQHWRDYLNALEQRGPKLYAALLKAHLGWLYQNGGYYKCDECEASVEDGDPLAIEHYEDCSHRDECLLLRSVGQVGGAS